MPHTYTLETRWRGFFRSKVRPFLIPVGRGEEIERGFPPSGFTAIRAGMGGACAGVPARKVDSPIPGNLVLFITIQERNECDPDSHP